MTICPISKYLFRHAPDLVYVTELRGSALEFFFVVGRLLLHTCFLSKAQLRQWILRVPSVSWICCAPKTETDYRLLVEVGLDTTGRGSSFARGTIHRSSANRPDWMPCLFPSAQEIQSFRYLGICRISCRLGFRHMNYVLASMTEMQKCSWRGYQNGPRRRSQHPSSSLMCSRSRCCVPSGNTFLFAACCGDVHFAFLDGACQRESAESNGSNNK